MAAQQQGNLRNRKHNINPSPAAVQDTPTVQQEDLVDDDNADKDTDDHFRLTPLIERSLLLRLDLGPFLVCYLGWILLDQQQTAPLLILLFQHASQMSRRSLSATLQLAYVYQSIYMK